MFLNCGVLHIDKEKIKEDELFEIAINAGAKDCLTLDNIFEVITEKEDFYRCEEEDHPCRLPHEVPPPLALEPKPSPEKSPPGRATGFPPPSFHS